MDDEASRILERLTEATQAGDLLDAAADALAESQEAREENGEVPVPPQIELAQ